MKNLGDRIFVTGIGTGIGKSVISAVLVKALEADYWKPVQCGLEGGSDRQQVATWAGSPEAQFYAEQFVLQAPVSPHLAAAQEGKSIHLADFKLPQSQRPLVVEGCGGVLVPLNNEDAVIDIAAKFGMSVIVVVAHYLGSYNHSLLSIEALRNRGLPLLGLCCAGRRDAEAAAFLSAKMELPLLLEMEEEAAIDATVIAKYANIFRERMERGFDRVRR